MRPKTLSGGRWSSSRKLAARLSLLAVALAALAAAAKSASANATFVINNLDPANVGFNDATAVAPVGGNNGQTLGQQRMNVFLYATQTWGRAIDSPVPIYIDAHFAPLSCGAFVTLGMASAADALANTPGLPPNMFFPHPLAERIVGRDLSSPPGSGDIEAVFNGDLNGCDSTLDWYYGLDGNAGDLIDLAETVLHELAHGLGFTTMVDFDTGELSSGILDVFSSHILDNSTSQMWSQMTDSQRLTSLQNVRHVVWSGDYVMAALPTVLAKGAPQLVAQPAITGLVANLGEMNFGPLVADMGAMGPTLVGNPSDGCADLGTHPGVIFVLQGGDCSPLEQVYNATNAGGKAVLITDENGYSPPSSVELPDSQIQMLPPSIPSLAITNDDGITLQNHPGATVTLSGQSNRLVGADEAGRPYLYAAVPIQPGSSISHWDTLARPDLLEEPQSGFTHRHDITMETALLRDIGWTPLPCGDGGSCDAGTGGSTSGTGGHAGTGGSNGAGGHTGTGGANGAGGSNAGTGGSNAGTGGSNAGVGGSPGTHNDAGTVTPPPAPKSGCGCATADGRPVADLSLLGLLAALALTRKVGRPRRCRR